MLSTGRMEQSVRRSLQSTFGYVKSDPGGNGGTDSMPFDSGLLINRWETPSLAGTNVASAPANFMRRHMPDFFVWSLPSLIEIVEAASEQDAAEAFLRQPVTMTPNLSKPPACFVQPASGLDLPRTDGSSVEFWTNEGAPS